MQCYGRFSSIALRTARRAERRSRPASRAQPVDASSVERSIAVFAMSFALASVSVASGIGSATAAETAATAAETECPSEDNSVPCQADEAKRQADEAKREADEAEREADEAERIAIFVRARKGYEDARTSGDFSESLVLSRQLAAQGNRAAKGLLRMVYMQLGSGTHKDYVQAYVWLSEGIARSADYPVKGGADFVSKWRKRLEEKMTPDQIAQAKKLAGN